ncbi:MAG: murein hydrolase activator EnvC family protein [Candidatus Limnocylindrales bacterium]
MRTSPRHGRRRAFLAILLALPLACSLLATVPAVSADDLGDAQAQQAALQQKIKAQRAALAALRTAEAQLKAALAETSQQLSAINANQAVLRAQIGKAEAALTVVRAQYAALVAELDHLDWTLSLLETELQQSRADLDARKRLLAERLAEAYQTNQTSLLEQILTADSFTQVLSQVSDYLSQGDQDAVLAAQIQEDQRALQALQDTTEATRFKTDGLRADVQAQAQDLAVQEAGLVAAKHQLDLLEAKTRQLQAQQLAAFRKAHSSQAAAAAALRAEQRAEQELQQQINALIQQQGGAIPSAYNGTFMWPMVGTITQEFGCTGFYAEPPLGNCAHFHRGIDIAAPSGTKIRAAGDGTVVFVGYNPYDPPGDRAWIVIIAHAQNLQTWYAHMQPIIPSGVYDGAHVSKGQLIGYEGCTGNCTGPHLHWAVLLDDSWVNPRLFL